MVKNQVHSSQSGTFDISAAMLHIIAMTFMLMDHLWATLLPAQDWLTCVGRLAFPIFAFMAVEGYFHTALKSTFSGCCCLRCCRRSPLI